ncbi:MAG: 2-hydroxyacyl-CoA dehydratase [Vulcanimicrobiaceae bacterium]
MTTLTASPSLEDLVEQCRKTFDIPGVEPAVAWKHAEPGRALIGCFPIYTPVEIFHAAGAMPVGLAGGGNRLEIVHSDSRFQSFVCSIIKSTLEQGMTGMLDEIDGMVFHSICDSARNLASVYARNFENTPVEYIHYPQNFAAPEASTHLRCEYQRVAKFASSITGTDVTDGRLNASIALYNDVRRMIRELYALRAEHPHAIRTSELYSLVRVGNLIPPEEHATVLTQALSEIGRHEGKARDRLRIVIVGSFCEQPPIDLIAAVEDAGCYVVDDDFLIGRRWFTKDIDAHTSDPLFSLADAYRHDSLPSPVKHDLRVPQAQMLIERARRLNADAVIVLCAKFCEPALFAYPLYRKALQAAGIPNLFLEFEEKMWMFDRVKNEIETFVESMLFA